jgi:hypothetical protein
MEGSYGNDNDNNKNRMEEIMYKFTTALNTIKKEPFSKRPDRLWSPPSLLFNEYRSSFLEIQRLRPEADHLPLSSANVKNKWSCTSTPYTPVWYGQVLYFLTENTLKQTHKESKNRTKCKEPSRYTASLIKWSNILHMKCHLQQTNTWLKDYVCCLE